MDLAKYHLSIKLRNCNSYFAFFPCIGQQIAYVSNNFALLETEIVILLY